MTERNYSMNNPKNEFDQFANAVDGEAIEDPAVATAHRLRHMSKPHLPPPAVARIERETLKALRIRRKPIFQLPVLARQWAVALSLVVALLAAAGTGTVAAAADSLPGDALYSIKRLSESTRIAVTPASGRAELHLRFAEERLDEIERLYNKGVVLAATLEDMEAETQSVIALIDSAPPDYRASTLARLVQLIDRQQSVLARVRANAPPSAQEALAHAQSMSAQGKANAVNTIKSIGIFVPPGQGQVPPGQLKKTASPVAGGDDSQAPANATKEPKPSHVPQTPPGLQNNPGNNAGGQGNNNSGGNDNNSNNGQGSGGKP